MVAIMSPMEHTQGIEFELAKRGMAVVVESYGDSSFQKFLDFFLELTTYGRTTFDANL